MPLLRLALLTIAPLVCLSAIAALAAILAFGVFQLPAVTLDFSLMVTRGAQVLLLIAIFPAARYLKIGRVDLGFPTLIGTAGRQLGFGFLVGLAILTIHVAALLALGAIKPNPHAVFGASEVWHAFLSASWVGFLVAAIEELIFRGMMLSALLRFGHAVPAAIITAFYYAWLHFLKSDMHPGPDEVEWTSGFAVFADGIHYIFSETPVDCLLALFLAGLFLATIRLVVPRSLALCVGIHAGWVVVIKIARRLTDPDPQAAFARLVGPYDQIIGYGAAMWLSMLLLVMVAYSVLTRGRTNVREGARGRFVRPDTDPRRWKLN